MLRSKLEIPLSLWRALIAALKKRGKGIRESGAFLLGEIDSKKVKSFICYDDLDPRAFDTGIIVFESYGFTPLWQYCRENKMRVIADIHTHPGIWTGQSLLDKTNPMIVERGHIALIVPKYARRWRQSLNGVGMYEYLGDFNWLTIAINDNQIKILKNE
ncbi:MAG: hypothetical protein JWQ38_2100 [Flavipsychrobacter sp.]|nr:hypothetical protein [Flavipsychrobacter sp.]